MQFINGLVTAAMFGAGMYLIITINGIANVSSEKGRRLLRNALLFLLVIPMILGFLKGLLAMEGDTGTAMYYVAYISSIAGVFLLAKGLRQAIQDASASKPAESTDA